MTTSLASSLFEVILFGLTITGCVSESASTGRSFVAPDGAEVVASLDGGVLPARRPDGVVIEVPPALPQTESRSTAGILALREPASDSEVAHVVVAFFEAWQRQSLDALMALLTRDAGPLGGRVGGRAALADEFRQRLQAHDFGRLGGTALIRPERMARWTWDELDIPRGQTRPPEMQPGEIFVVAPVEVTHVGGERLFGDRAEFVLRREGGELRIASYGEIDP